VLDAAAPRPAAPSPSGETAEGRRRWDGPTAGFGTVDRVPSRCRTLLPAGLHAAAAAAVVLATTVVAVLALQYGGDDTAGRVDGRLDRVVDTLPGQHVAAAVAQLGSPPVVIVAAVVVALICLVGGHVRGAVLALGGPGLTGLVTTFGKPVVDRTIGGTGYAFPSGHTGGSTSLALVVALLVAAAWSLGRRSTALFATVCAVGAGGAVGTGMVVRGSHYPTDVVGGFCTAVASVLAVALVLDVLMVRRRVPARH
jgi:membrane-associated phospholipid phosphatase